MNKPFASAVVIAAMLALLGGCHEEKQPQKPQPQFGVVQLTKLYQDSRIRLQLNYPDELKGMGENIETEVRDILARNGIKAEELYFGTSNKSIPIAEAFPKIFERKNSINVKI